MLRFSQSLLLFLAACASVSPPPERPEAPSPDTYLQGLVDELEKAWPDNRSLRIVCHGHSVPAGYFVTPAVETFDAYPHLLHRALKERFPRAVLNVIVTALGGENSIQGSERFVAEVLCHRPDLITIDYALNDRRADEGDVRAAWEAMLREAAAAGVPVLLLTPTLDLRADLDDPNDLWNQRAALVRELAARHGVGLVDSSAAFRAAIAAGVAPAALMSQGNHPNRRGHDLVVRELLRWWPQ